MKHWPARSTSPLCGCSNSMDSKNATINGNNSELKNISRPADHYGLTLIVGGAEASLWEIANVYTCLARHLSHFYKYDGRYNPSDFRPAHFRTIENNSDKVRLHPKPTHLSAAAVWHMLEAMQQVRRPNSEGDWELFRSNSRVAWKTGTSFGYRDAWAIGLDGRHTVGVWVGNADGEGRPGLVGVKVAGPILFDVMSLLEPEEWFEQPFDEMTEIAVCRKSGYRALPICPTDTLLVAASGLKSPACPYHRLLHLDESATHQVSDRCLPVNDMRQQPWFVLPPLEEHYYIAATPSYHKAPPYREGCQPLLSTPSQSAMQFIYPKSFTSVYIPVDLDGNKSKVVFKVAHRRPESTIYWHLDDTYVGATRDFHHLELAPPVGEHILTLVDERGERLVEGFEVVE